MENKSVNIERYRIIALKNGDTTAFDELFKLYGLRLFHFALGYLKSRSDAEEIVQDVFLKVWRNRASLDPELSFSSYLFTIAYRDIALQLRKTIQRHDQFHELIETMLPFSDDLNERTDYQSLIERVEAIVNKLPDRQREVFILHKIEGFSVAQVAKKLGIARKTVENHFSQAGKSLRAAFDNEFPNGWIMFLLFDLKRNACTTDCREAQDAGLL